MRDVCPVECVSPWFDVMKCSVAQFRFVYCLFIRVIWFTTHVCNKHTFISSRICMCAICKRICVFRAGFGFWISYLTWNHPKKHVPNKHTQSQAACIPKKVPLIRHPSPRNTGLAFGFSALVPSLLKIGAFHDRCDTLKVCHQQVSCHLARRCWDGVFIFALLKQHIWSLKQNMFCRKDCFVPRDLEGFPACIESGFFP